MQPIQFFDDGIDPARDPEDVRLLNLGIFVYDDRRRVAVGFELTPFRRRPSLEITVTNSRGETAGTMTVIEAFSPNFNLTVHLRDREPTTFYDVEAVVYYDDKNSRLVVDRKQARVNVQQPGDQTVWREEEE